ncbi:hypothetical protein A3I51_03055 [Candidatus Gottesmanbacteria bacterium RIFCSPLOWO2_02_FULL_38_8]|uniref:DNA-directed DNA polymerase n=1 Tax=Candidatus Gottesmanbacteria bacterium RIFCSPLOWO2_02_FULL_38_8 TaxID=1798397 RepID=A0A1F6B5W6_9BACT|nr:MAG: hypothetical protein A3I51_03055 [Candidatus Gottesmanbacteria bacterium RIFCSPLOWO2_02_FULL_38_8]
MKILIHGVDNAKSRLKLREILEDKIQEKIFLEGKKVSFQEAVLACETSSLIAEDKIIVLENFFQRKESREKSAILAYLFNSSFSFKVIFWEDKELDKRKIKNLSPNLQIYHFDYPGTLFKFLDGLGIQSSASILNQFHLLLKNNDSQLIFSFIVRQFRFLLMIYEEKNNSLAIPDWQFFKLKRQAQNFNLDKLINLYRQLLQIDYRVKTGQTPLQLDQLLDFFLVNI